MTILDKMIGRCCESEEVRLAYAELNALRLVAERAHVAMDTDEGTFDAAAEELLCQALEALNEARRMGE